MSTSTCAPKRTWLRLAGVAIGKLSECLSHLDMLSLCYVTSALNRSSNTGTMELSRRKLRRRVWVRPLE